MKFNTIETIEIEIRDNEENTVLILDKDVRYLFMLLAKWLVEEAV